VVQLLPRTRGARRWTLGLVVLVVALGAGGAAWAATRGSSATATSTLATASSGPIRQTVSATGTLAPKREADLTFAVDGTVTSVSARVGAKVTKGDPLARVDRSALNIDREAARANVTAAESQLAADQDSGASDAQLSSDEANLRSARATLDTAKEAVADATLRSTINGTIASVDIAVGDQVTGGASPSGNGASASSDSSSTASSTQQIVVISTDEFVVTASVTASDLASVKKGLQAEITPAGATKQVFGTVASVGMVAESSTSGSSTFPVVIDVTGKVADVYAGSSADVSIVVKALQNVLTVPTAAVSSSNGKSTVTVVKNGKQHATVVTIGAVYGPRTQITKGISAGDQVLVQTARFGGTTTGRTGQQGGFGGGGFGGGGFGGGQLPPGESKPGDTTSGGKVGGP
jgi:membrane fusion protein, macrolide-specific efflux system